MRIPSGSTDRKIAFVAVDSTDLKTRKTGLSGFTVYRSRDGGAATAYTTPTVAELSAANMPGVYVLTIDEDTTVAAGHDVEEYVVHITQASMAPVTRAIEIERVKFTEGQSGTMADGAVDADIERLQGSAIATPTVAGVLEVDVTHFGGTAGVFAGGRPEANVNSIAAGAVSAAAIGTGAIDADALAADAVAEIADGVLDEDMTGHQIQGSLGQAIGDPVADTNTIYKAVVTDATGATVGADTDNIRTRLPAALVSGRIDASVGAVATDAISAAGVSAGAANKVADHTLRRTYANARASSDGDAVNFRSLLGAIGKLVNKWAISGSTLTVYQEDDVTSTAPGGTQAITGSAGANPITELDTN